MLYLWSTIPRRDSQIRDRR